jgi:FkbM family methyltransferase
MKVMFEVGANHGNDIQVFLDNNPDSRVIGFEPTPDLAAALRNRYANDTRVTIIEAAVDIENTIKTFNIAKSSGCNSLHEFTDNIQTLWPGHSELEKVQSIAVQCVRLDTIMAQYNIDKIDYLEIDTQGNDFNVLKSLGNRLSNVVRGKCEVFYELDLYKSQNRCEIVKEWLESNGFDVEVRLHTEHHKEADLHFSNKSIP